MPTTCNLSSFSPFDVFVIELEPTSPCTGFRPPLHFSSGRDRFETVLISRKRLSLCFFIQTYTKNKWIFRGKFSREDLFQLKRYQVEFQEKKNCFEGERFIPISSRQITNKGIIRWRVEGVLLYRRDITDYFNHLIMYSLLTEVK